MPNDPNTFDFLRWSWTLLAVPIGMLWWIIKSVVKSLSDTKDGLAEHKLYAANNYVKHSDLRQMEERILRAIGDLKSDLKGKADK
jgi:hypothetical protein|tara:strand:+ start:1854 stop:2108 length:255 start_codon:yes stop_codon:yes gene_type:complete